MWHILRDGAGAAAEQMALDVRLAAEAQRTVRVFTWNPPAMSWGLKQELPEWLNDRGTGRLERVERPTGGGIAFHGSDVSVSVVVPRPNSVPLAALMEAVCRSAAALCHSYGVRVEWPCDDVARDRVTYCLTQPSPYAVLVGRRKLAGFAIRRFPESWLLQGSLLARPLPRLLAELLPPDVLAALAEHAVALSEVSTEVVDPDEVADRWARYWAEWWDAHAL